MSTKIDCEGMTRTGVLKNIQKGLPAKSKKGETTIQRNSSGPCQARTGIDPTGKLVVSGSDRPAATLWKLIPVLSKKSRPRDELVRAPTMP